MKIVILEADSLGQDMVFTPFEALGEVVIYPTTTADEMEEKTKDADVIVANKVPICESTIGKARNLKLVCLTATGFNNPVSYTHLEHFLLTIIARWKLKAVIMAG